MSENERNTPQTTTLSTIAIQNVTGKTRIVIALLKSKDVLELKILELVPDLTLLGETFEEASELEIAHNHVMKQLQNKQSPVEEMLKKADQVIADQKPKPEVYAAMADSLGQAWKDIHSHLALRKHILHMNVTYHSKAEACMERMRALELLCLSPIPSNENMVKESLQCLQEIKKSMLECLMASLNAGQNLLAALNEIANEKSLDSRPGRIKKSALSAIAQVEQWMEQLHNRRRLLDVTWQRRKLNLEKYRTLAILKWDLELLETLLRERYELLSRSRYELGDSSASAELLLQEHLKLVPEATNFQEEGLRMVKASEQLPSSGHKFSEKSNQVSYDVLNLANEYMQAINDKEDLLRKCISFFKSAKSVMMKLEEMNYQLNNVNSISERLIIMNMTEDITKDVINDGRWILEKAPAAKGVQRALDEIENAKLNLMSYCIKQNEENFEISQIVNTFYEKQNQIFSWLITAVESFIQGHQDMGGGLSMAQNYLQVHEQLLNDLRIRSTEVIDITESVPPHILARLPSNTKEDILQKLEMITSHWEYLKKTLEERIRLSVKYTKFHSLAVSLANELDSFDKSLLENDITEVGMLPAQHSDNIDGYYTQLNDVAAEFLDDLSQTQDSYLDVKRAQLCVETVLEHFANRKTVVEDKWTIWERSAFDKKTSQTLWSKNMVDSENTIDWVSKLESQLYPVLNVESVSTDVQIHQVNDKLNNIIPEIKRAQQEIQLRIRTAKELIAKGTLETNEEVPPKLNELYNDICTIIVQYTVFLEMFTTFLNNVKELEKKITDLKSTNDRVNELSSKQVNDLKVKHVAASKAFHDLWDITFVESQRIIDKIEHQEPVKYGEKDIHCINNLLQRKKTEWEELSSSFETKLKRWQILKQFDEDLESIHTSIRELSEELSALQHQYSLSLSAAKSSSVAFQYFERTIQALEGKIDSFINTAEDVLEISESKSSDINQLKDCWNKFCAQVTETRRFIDLSIQYFTLIDETEECFREGTKLLVCVARKSSTARTPDEAEELLTNIQTFQSSAQVKQEERINLISKLVAELFDNGEHARQVNRIVLENNDMLDSFLTVSKELSILQQKLKTSADSVKPVKDEIVATEIVSLEKLPTSLHVENVEVIHLIEEEKSISQKSEISETSPDSSLKELSISLESVPKSEKPIFISPLNDGQIKEGSRFVFECKVTGYPTPQITWLKEGFVIENNPDYQTTYSDGLCRLRIEETFAEDSAKFACRATNEAGVAETSAKLTVIENEVVDELQPPSFIIPLFDEIVRVGDVYEFHCKVGGNPLPDVQWYKNETGVDSLPEFESTFNNGDAKLLIKNVVSDDNAKFSCTAINSLGTATSSANLTVKSKTITGEAPIFVTKLSNVMARAGQKFKLECRVTGKPFPTLSWTHNGKPLKETSNMNMSIDDAGNVTLAISEAFPKDAGTYTLTATNAAGETSCTSNVSVKGLLPCETSDSEIPSDVEPARPSIKMPLKDLTVTEASEALLECVIVGLPEPEVIWYHNNVPIKESKDIQLLFKGDKCSLLIKEACPEDEGEYKVIAINSAGETSSTAHLCVQSSSKNEIVDSEDIEGIHPKFTKLLSDILVREGDTAVLDCAVEGYPKPSIKWFLNTSEINYSDRIECEENADGTTKLTIKNIVPEDKGLYTVRASNSLGEAKCFSHMIIKSLSSMDSKPSTELYLKDKLEYPSFVETFTDKTISEGGFVKFECIATGKPSPKVRWLFNNEPVSGKSFLVSTSGDRQVLSVPEADIQNEGLITCVAENEAGKATCTARLQVLLKIHESLIPTLDTTMNVFESNQSFEMKKAIFSKSSATNDGLPVTKMDSYITVHEEASQKINDNEPVKMESRHVEERHETDGKLEQSSQSFSFGNLDVQNKIKASKECTVASLKPARKQTAPRFITTIDGVIVDEGADVKFESVVESYPPATIAWYRNNEQLFDIPNKISITWELNKASLKLKNVMGSDAGRYSCTASNDAGSASSAADLFVKKNIFPPVMGKRLHPQSVAVGHRVTFEVEVTGTPTPLVTWFKDDIQLAKISPFYRLRDQGNSHALIIEKVRLEDIGQYKIRAYNEAGEAVSIATLNVFEPPPLTNNSITSQYSFENQSFDSQVIPTNNFESKNYSSQFNSSHKSEFKSVSSKTDKKIKFNVDENDKPIEPKKEHDFSSFSKEYEITKPSYDFGGLGETKSQSFETFKKEESFSKNTNGFKETNLYSMDYSKTNDEPPVQKEAFSSYSSYEPFTTPAITPYTNSFILEPGPPPEIGYIPKEAVPKAREAMAERVKKLESSQRQLSPVEIPPGAVRIFPTIVPKKKDNVDSSALEKKYSSCIKEYKKTIGRSVSNENTSHVAAPTPAPAPVTPTPNILISETPAPAPAPDLGPIYRPCADVDLRPASPRPSAEGVSMERLWSHHKKTEEILRPTTPKSELTEPMFKVTDIKRSLSPVPSAEGVAMDKLWSHPTSGDKRRPHSVIGLSDSISTEKVTENTWSSGGYDVKENFKSEIVEDKKVTSKSTCSLQRSISEEKQKKKFKWPPQEVSFEDSLVRKTSDKFNLEPGPPPEISYAQPPSNFEQSSYVKTTEKDLEKSIDQTAQKYVYGGVRVVPAPVKSTFSSSYEKQESSNYQTLPRSFKFASSSDSKFKPVKPYVKSPQTTSKESVSENYAAHNESFSSFSDQKVTNLRESGYAADTDEPNFRSTFLQRNNAYPKPIFQTTNYQKYDESNKTHTLPRVSENKVTRTLNESKTSTTKSFTPTYGPINPPKFSKSDFRESDYESDFDSRIPPIWRPSDSEPEEPHYRPVRPNLTPVKRTFSNQNEYSSSSYSDNSVSKFQPVSPAVYQPKPTCGENISTFNKYKAYGYTGDAAASTEIVKPVNDFKTYQRANSYEDYQHSVSESVDKSSFSKYSSEVKRIQKVEEIKKRFESRSTSYTDDASFRQGDSSEVFSQSRIPVDNFASSKQSETFKSYKTNSQQFIDDIVNKVNNKQNELKQGALKSPSLYSPPVFSRDNEPQVFRDHYRNTEHGIERLDPNIELIFFKYDFGYEYRLISPALSEDKPSTMPPSNQSDIPVVVIPKPYNIPGIKPKKIIDVDYSTWTPKICPYRSASESLTRRNQTVSSNEAGWTSDVQRSTEAEYVIINGNSEFDKPQKAPVFTTPLHDIAAVIGSSARFECIVQSDPPLSIVWRKDGEVLRDTDLLQINFRNGVCKLALLKAYKYDAGTYQCIAKNSGGIAETSATLIVSGERRSYIKK